MKQPAQTAREQPQSKNGPPPGASSGFSASELPQAPKSRLRVAVRGAVQGVGFRPFVYRLATQMHLNGWVNNSPQGVFIEVEGAKGLLDEFLLRLGA